MNSVGMFTGFYAMKVWMLGVPLIPHILRHSIAINLVGLQVDVSIVEKALPWTATGLFEAEKKFRKVKGYRELEVLQRKLNH